MLNDTSAKIGKNHFVKSIFIITYGESLYWKILLTRPVNLYSKSFNIKVIPYKIPYERYMLNYTSSIIQVLFYKFYYTS
jgi:hypothetical protein